MAAALAASYAAETAEEVAAFGGGRGFGGAPLGLSLMPTPAPSAGVTHVSGPGKPIMGFSPGMGIGGPMGMLKHKSGAVYHNAVHIGGNKFMVDIPGVGRGIIEG